MRWERHVAHGREKEYILDFIMKVRRKETTRKTWM
jgi:hypothetical protein